MRNFLIWLAIIVVIALLFDAFNKGTTTSNELAFSEFMSEVESSQVRDVVIQGRQITGHYMDGSTFSTFAPDYPNLVDRLQDQGVRIQAAPVDTGTGGFLGILLGWLPILLFIGILIYFMRQMQSGGRGGGGAMGFGRSRARMMTENQNRVTFENVAGIEEAKDELSEIVDFLKDPGKFQKLGGKIPKGCLLVGSPGTGKTLLARAIAGEANVPFFSISGSEFVEMFVGVGASRVRDMFEQAKKNAPCIVFIDEIDAVGRHRGAGLGGGNDEREQTLNQLLVEMDGFEANEGVIIIAATNRPDVLDPALLRPGRFDRQIVVPVPDIAGREKILLVHMKKLPLGPDVDANVIARGTPGFSGADLANLVNEAALLAARRNKKVVTMREFEESKDKVMMGVERKSMVMTDEEKELTAYHEAGHALVSLHSPASDPIHKATIIPRGRALGMVMRLPERDRHSVTREKLTGDIAVAMGGRVAEELIFGAEKITTGASSDIKHATDLARNMVMHWGMSDKVGPLFHGDGDQEVFLGRSISQGRAMADDTAKLIDSEVKRLVNDGYERAKELLKQYNSDLHLLAKGLLDYETLTGDEIKDLLAGKEIQKESANDNKATRSSAAKRKSSKPTPKTDGDAPTSAPDNA